MFLGEHQHTLDAKGRVILPAAYRERLSSGVVLSRGPERCLDVYPASTFERRLENLRRLPRERRENRNYLRMLTAGAHSDTLDSQGRVTIPVTLREYAGLERELTVVGADEKVEIWDRERWDAWMREQEDSFAELDTDFAGPPAAAGAGAPVGP